VARPGATTPSSSARPDSMNVHITTVMAAREIGSQESEPIQVVGAPLVGRLNPSVIGAKRAKTSDMRASPDRKEKRAPAAAPGAKRSRQRRRRGSADSRSRRWRGDDGILASEEGREGRQQEEHDEDGPEEFEAVAGAGAVRVDQVAGERKRDDQRAGRQVEEPEGQGAVGEERLEPARRAQKEEGEEQAGRRERPGVDIERRLRRGIGPRPPHHPPRGAFREMNPYAVRK